mmetsp:Transcript_41379/g.46143  ORF Transcript_41379/g.46143 Transcript_41379/m.46143 type:complete len:90 (+) Transcript_41379:1001-1270(+)
MTTYFSNDCQSDSASCSSNRIASQPTPTSTSAQQNIFEQPPTPTTGRRRPPNPLNVSDQPPTLTMRQHHRRPPNPPLQQHIFDHLHQAR